MTPKSPKESSSLILSPYPVQENKEGFTFRTKYGTSYQLAFSSNKAEFPYEPFGDNCLTVTLIPLKGYNLPKRYSGLADPRVELTIMGQFVRLFRGNPELVLNYSCDTSNYLERHRNIIFGRWYTAHLKPIGVARIHYANATQRLYGAVWYHEDNPHKHRIEEVFSVIFKGK